MFQHLPPREKHSMQQYQVSDSQACLPKFTLVQVLEHCRVLFIFVLQKLITIIHWCTDNIHFFFAMVVSIKLYRALLKIKLFTSLSLFAPFYDQQGILGAHSS